MAGRPAAQHTVHRRARWPAAPLRQEATGEARRRGVRLRRRPVDRRDVARACGLCGLRGPQLGTHSAAAARRQRRPVGLLAGQLGAEGSRTLDVAARAQARAPISVRHREGDRRADGTGRSGRPDATPDARHRRLLVRRHLDYGCGRMHAGQRAVRRGGCRHRRHPHRLYRRRRVGHGPPRPGLRPRPLVAFVRDIPNLRPPRRSR